MENVEAEQGWVIWCERPITRRKRFHSVVNPQGVVEWKSRHLGECVEYLAAQGILCYLMRVEPFDTRERLDLEVNMKGTPQWQN